MDALARRFWSKVLHDRDGCWEWQGGRWGHGWKGRGKGYGSFWMNGKTVSAHRVALMLAKPSMYDPSLHVLHTCDNPICCRPGHLWQGTNADNVSDRERKGRGNQHKGEEQVHAKLSEAQVRAILADDRSQVEIAKTYGVTQAQVSNIKRRAHWKHLKD